MKTQLEELLDDGADLIDRMEDTKESVASNIETLSGAATDIENAIAELSRQTTDLQR